MMTIYGLRSWSALYCALLVLQPLGAQIAAETNKQTQLEEIVRSFPAGDKGALGFIFTDLESGKVLAECNAARLFTPASNTKLYTTAMALLRLGANYRFRTQIMPQAHWTPGETTVSGLVLVGGGDPNLSGRAIPYQAKSKPGNVFAAFENLTQQLTARGIELVRGDIIGDGTRYPADTVPHGWTVDDTDWGYGAAVSGLTFNDGVLEVAVQPTTPGELAGVEVNPLPGYLTVLNQTVTIATGPDRVEFYHPPNSDELVVSGTISQTSKPVTEEFAAPDPARYAAAALRQMLLEHGISVLGDATSTDRPPNEIPDELKESIAVPPENALATYWSAPLQEDIKVTNKVSQNLHAEMLLREVAFNIHGIGTLKAGVKEREAFLNNADITKDRPGYDLADGSGLARQGLTSPATTSALLRYMWRRPEKDIWLSSLPVGGVDGTLSNRFKNIAGAERVHAKTGSLSHVHALSGYIETASHRWIAFSMMVNANTAPGASIRGAMDRICAIFLND